MIKKKTVSQCITSDYCNGWNDAVDSIVRCKDCIYGKNNYFLHGLCLCTIEVYDNSETPIYVLYPEDHFCRLGERMEDNA